MLEGTERLLLPAYFSATWNIGASPLVVLIEKRTRFTGQRNLRQSRQKGLSETFSKQLTPLLGPSNNQNKSIPPFSA